MVTVVGAGLGCLVPKSKGQVLLSYVYTLEKAITRDCVCC